MKILIIFIAFQTQWGCTSEETTVNHPTVIELCGYPPNENEYPTIQAWRDEALVWMTCARFSCSELVVP